MIHFKPLPPPSRLSTTALSAPRHNSISAPERWTGNVFPPGTADSPAEQMFVSLFDPL